MLEIAPCDRERVEILKETMCLVVSCGHAILSETLSVHPLVRWFVVIELNKAGYTATLVACGWAGAVLEKVTRASGHEPYAQKAQKH